MNLFCLGFNPEKNTYHTVASNLKSFQEINGLSARLHRRCEQYATVTDLVIALIEKGAVFHKCCIAQYNKQKLTRKRKRDESVQCANNEKSITSPSNTPAVDSSSRSTRRTLEIKSFSQSCLFCDQVDDAINLHQCQTLELNQRVQKIANDLVESTLLAKLSDGDVVATEAKYHRKCLATLYNRHRDFKKAKSNDAPEEKLIEGNFIQL